MGRTSMRMLKKVGISMAAAIILVVLATIIGATGAQAGGRQDYPGNGAEAITAYLYNDANISGDYSTTFELMPNESDVFSMLTAATTYRVGVESDGWEYTLTITD